MAKVELYGIPRSRAGVAETHVEAATLGEAIGELSRRYPVLAAECFDKTRLRSGYVANLNGERFVTDLATALSPDDCLLILSADAGG